jgi:hypothetical protein
MFCISILLEIFKLLFEEIFEHLSKNNSNYIFKKIKFYLDLKYKIILFIFINKFELFNIIKTKVITH